MPSPTTVRARACRSPLAAPPSPLGRRAPSGVVAVSDMFHHRTFRGTYTKTLQPSGSGEIAARAAVGLPPLAKPDAASQAEAEECLIWSPTGVCLQTKAEAEAWRKRRFERVQMEGTRDPRRGGSGTTR